jgi:hypothetical protein
LSAYYGYTISIPQAVATLVAIGAVHQLMWLLALLLRENRRHKLLVAEVVAASKRTHVSSLPWLEGGDEDCDR